MQGDATNRYPERPPITDVRNRMMYDNWIKLDGMSKEDAMKKYLELAKPIVERNGHSWDNPKKKLID